MDEQLVEQFNCDQAFNCIDQQTIGHLFVQSKEHILELKYVTFSGGTNVAGMLVEKYTEINGALNSRSKIRARFVSSGGLATH